MISQQEIKQLLSRPAYAYAQQAASLKTGSVVWFNNIKHKQDDIVDKFPPFFQATVLKRTETHAKLQLKTDIMKCKQDLYTNDPVFDLELGKVLPANQGPLAEDMVDMQPLNHATLLYNLEQRYDQDKIYTYVGPTLLAVNPFKRVDHYYTQQNVSEYKNIIKSKHPLVYKEMEPHIFAIAALAYKQMMETNNKQAIIISGESGAGKTQGAKHCMKFLTSLSAEKSESFKNLPSIAQGIISIEDKILKCNPVLQAFGNAKTIRNNNSSRFGKYVKLIFDGNTGSIMGAMTINYLLEKSRVVQQTPQERNYHVFYHLIKGQDVTLQSKLGLISEEGDISIGSFSYLKNGADVPQNIIDDASLFSQLVEQFTDLGFSVEEQDVIWSVVASCLHLGNLQFDTSTYSQAETPCSIKNPILIKQIARLLGVQTDQLILQLVHKTKLKMVTQRSPHPLKNCIQNRDSLAKALYDNLFSWLIKRMNRTILPKKQVAQPLTIGLLDIFGFQNFKHNDFQQLCINYTNEKLHKLYIQCVFDAEKLMLKEEGLDTLIPNLSYPTNTGAQVILLLDKRAKSGDPIAGILTMCNDMSSQNPQPTWESYMGQLVKAHTKNPKLQIDKKDKNKDKFIIIHSAKQVKYDIKNFIEKNSDQISSSLDELMKFKAGSIVSCIYRQELEDAFDDYSGSPGGDSDGEQVKSSVGSIKTSLKTIWSKFIRQMNELMDELAATPNAKVPCDLHFIRCIKPNQLKESNNFVRSMTLQQIRYMGVLQSIEVKRQNYPNRRKFKDFYQRYQDLCSVSHKKSMLDLVRESANFRQLSTQLLDEVFGNVMTDGQRKKLLAVGNYKVLFMNEILTVLERIRDKISQKKTYDSNLIKDCLKLFKARAQFRHSIFQVYKFQRWWNNRKMILAEMRSQLFYDMAVESIYKFKSELRKDRELQAANIIIDTVQKKRFIDIVSKGLTSRQKAAKSLTVCSKMLYYRKMYFAVSLERSIFNKAWRYINRQWQLEGSFTIQRMFRGFLARQKKRQVVLQAESIRNTTLKDKAARLLQKYARGKIVRDRLEVLRQAVLYIQGFIKSRWLNQLFRTMRGHVIRVQRHIRKFLTRKKVINSRMGSYLKKEVGLLRNQQMVQNAWFFSAAGGGDPLPKQPFLASSGYLTGSNKNSLLESQEILNNSDNQELALTDLQTEHQDPHRITPKLKEPGRTFLKAYTPYALKKISLFSRIFDLHVLTDTSLVYNPCWSYQWESMFMDCVQKDAPIQVFSIGDAHSVVLNARSQAYSWGWNDQGQCARGENQIQSQYRRKLPILLSKVLEDQQQQQCRIKQVACGSDHTTLLDSQGRLYSWGSNAKGQLGLGNYTNQYHPAKIEALQSVVIKQVAVAGYQNIACTKDGDVYIWPSVKENERISLPQFIPFVKTKITRVSCGFNFAVLITTQGLLLSFGQANRQGQLGHGDLKSKAVPQLIHSLKDAGERIDYVSCGFAHVIAISTLKKVFTWGWGMKGQLGHGQLISQAYPRFVADLAPDKGPKKARCLQVAAGYSHSVVLNDNRQVLWFGTNDQLQNQMKAAKCKLTNRFPDLFPAPVPVIVNPQLDFAIVRIQCEWSKMMSVTYFTIADLRAINGDMGVQKLYNTIWTLASKFNHSYLDPPYIDSISGLFHFNTMRKQQKASPSKKGKEVAQNQITMTQISLEQEYISQLSSNIFSAIAGKDKLDDSQVIKMQKQIKLIMQKPRDKWTTQEKLMVEKLANLHDQ